MKFLLLFLPVLAFAQSEPATQEVSISETAIFSMTIDGFPDFLATGENALWVTNEGRVEKLLFGRMTPVISVSVPEPCGAMAVGFGSLWVASCEKKAVYRIDLTSNRVTSVIASGLADASGELSIAVGAGSVWLLTSASGVLSRIDPIRNEVVSRIQVESSSFAAAFGFGSVWITNTKRSTAQRIDPKTEKVIATMKVGRTPRFLAVGLGSVWTLNQEDGTVSRIDPRKHEVISIEVNAKGTGGDIAAGEKNVYVRAKTSLLFVIDPHTNKVIQSYGPPAGSGAVRVEKGRVWITAHDIHKVWVIGEQ